MVSIFISYSRVDKKFTKELAELLSHSYDHVWYDTAKLVGGEKWWETILSKIESSDHFIFLLSPESIDSEYCQKELEEALKLNKHIIPVRIRERTIIPESLKSIQHIDSFDEITVNGLNKIYASIVRKNIEKPNKVNEISLSDIGVLNSIWPYITGRQIRTLLREVELESISSDTFNSLDEFLNLRSLPEFEFLDKQLEISFSAFSAKLRDFVHVMALNVWRDHYTDSYVSARKSASNEGRRLEHETEAILHYEKEVLQRAILLQQQHKKLVKTVKTVLPTFELVKV